MPMHLPNIFRISFLLFNVLLITGGCKTTSVSSDTQPNKKLKALIVDGQNNHGAWPKTTMIMKDYLEQSGLFTVDIDRTIYTWQGPHNDSDAGMGEAKRKQLLTQYPIPGGKQTIPVEKAKYDSTFLPDFNKYDLVISNFGWLAFPWPEKTKEALEKFVNNGGGLIVIHAADNSFPEWLEYNKMIALGGWGNRSEKDGPYVYYTNDNEIVRDLTPGSAGAHGPQLEMVITIRDTLHPITKGMPTKWLHAKDELYERLRGPAENLHLLGTSYVEKSGRHEPMLMTIDYGKGRVFHTPLGHTDYSMECVGFMIMFQRAAEWAATGTVENIAIPSDFPTATQVKSRKWNK
jgi:uncharacterized protein